MHHRFLRASLCALLLSPALVFAFWGNYEEFTADHFRQESFSAHEGIGLDAYEEFRRNQSLLQKYSERTSAIPKSFGLGAFRIQPHLHLGSSYTTQTPQKYLELQAYGNSFYYRSEKFGLEGGPLSYLRTGLTGHIGEHFIFSTDGAYQWRNRNFLNKDHSYYWGETWAGVKLNDLVLQAGRIQTQWGFGQINHMLFSNENAPFLGVKLKNLFSTLIDGFLSFLGSTRFEALWGRLDNDQSFPGGQIVGLYASFAPHRRWQFGLGQSVIFGGDGAPDDNPLVYFSEQFSDASNPTNRNFLFTNLWKIPGLEMNAYFEWMFEDCCGSGLKALNSRNTVQMGGLHAPFGRFHRDVDLNIEFVRTNEISYRHQTFRSGYVYDNGLFGPSIGPDAYGIYLQGKLALPRDRYLKSLFSMEKMGRTGLAIFNDNFSPPIPIEDVEPFYQAPNTRYRFELELYTPLPKFPVRLSSRFMYEFSKNQQYQQGLNEHHLGGGLELRYLF